MTEIERDAILDDKIYRRGFAEVRAEIARRRAELDYLGDPQAYRTQLKHFIDVRIAGNNVIERLFAERMPAPCMSLLVDDCVARGKDYHDGGPRYNPTYIQGVGLGTTTDSLAAIKYHCFDERSSPERRSRRCEGVVRVQEGGTQASICVVVAQGGRAASQYELPLD
jgi:pyruvate-formate lyase